MARQKLIKIPRLEKELSHNKLSIKAGITRPAISQIENGKRIPTMLVCLKISKALEIKLSDALAICEAKHTK